ncbi:MAG TPA: hypothetical protein DEQ34_11340, partial [Balneolaceae bacterium]|nr:hypothetical protein [Balneolaceae bacterium]
MKRVKLYLSIAFLSIVFVPISLQAQTNCDVSAIQQNLNNGSSVYSLLTDCSQLTAQDFYGKEYAGGVIVYLDPSTKGKGIVAANEDENSNSSWYNRLSRNGGLFNSSLVAQIGSGASNMAAACGMSGCGKPPKTYFPNYNSPAMDALYFVSSSNRNGFSDWYLPSSEELKVAYQNASSNFSSCPSGGWWTSTQIPASYTFPGSDFTIYQYKNYYPSSVYILNTTGELTWSSKTDGRCARAFRTFAPWIEAVNPDPVEVGMAVSISGSNFSEHPTNIEIQFPNGIKATPQESSGNTMTVIVPAGTTSGNLRVVVNGVQSNTIPIQIAPRPEGDPVISSFSKKMIIKTDSWMSDRMMTIYGSNFSLQNTVTFAGGAQVLSEPSSNPGQFVVNIPVGVKTGPITVSSGVGHSNPSDDTLFVFELNSPAAGLTTNGLNDVAIDTNETNIVVVGDNGTILTSENGGAHWGDSAYAMPPRYGNTTTEQYQTMVNEFKTSMRSATLHSVVNYTLGGTNVFAIWGDLNPAFQSNDYVQIYTLASDISGYWSGDGIPGEISNPYFIGGKLLAVSGRSGNAKIVERSGTVSQNTRVFGWTDVQSNVTELMDFAHNSTKLVSVGMMTTSPTQSYSNWVSTLPVGTDTWSHNAQKFVLNSVAWGKNVFVAVGREGSHLRGLSTMYYSSDGMNWTDATCDGEQCDINQRAVAYNERSGIFFSSGHLLKHYYSFDGKNWTS